MSANSRIRSASSRVVRRIPASISHSTLRSQPARSVEWLMDAGIRLTTREEADRIREFADMRVAWMAEEDLETLGFYEFREALSAGIAAHHAGMLPVFKDLWKFSGERRELLTPGEYTQLTGRAGRRGIDEIGHAVVVFQRQVPFERVA